MAGVGKKILLGFVVLIVVAVAGLWLLVRAALDPERMRVAIEEQGTKAIGAPLHVGGVSATIYPRIGLVLSDVTLDGAIRVTAKRAAVSTGLMQLLKKRVEDADVLVSDAQVELSADASSSPQAGKSRPPAPDRNASASTGPATDGSSGLGITIVSIREIAAENIALMGGGKTLRVSARGSLQGTTLELARIAIAAQATSIEGSGRVGTTANRLDGTLDLKASRLDVDELLSVTTALASALPKAPDDGAAGGSGAPSREPAAAATPPTDAPPTGSLSPDTASRIGSLKISLAADSGRVQGMEFKNLEAMVTRTGTRADVDPFSIGLFDGTLKGRVRLESIGSAIAVRVNGEVANANMATFLKAVEQPGSISGTLNASLALAGRGPDFTRASKALAGTASFAMTNGRIEGLDVVNTVLKALGATPTGDRSGESYQRMGGAFRIQPSGVQTDNFVMTAPDFELRAALKLARAGALDGKATILLGETVSSQIGEQYRAARLASEQNRIVLPAGISGSLDKPRILPDVKDILARAGKTAAKEGAKKAVNKAIGGLLKRRP